MLRWQVLSLSVPAIAKPCSSQVSDLQPELQKLLSSSMPSAPLSDEPVAAALNGDPSPGFLDGAAAAAGGEESGGVDQPAARDAYGADVARNPSPGFAGGAGALADACLNDGAGEPACSDAYRPWLAGTEQGLWQDSEEGPAQEAGGGTGPRLDGVQPALARDAATEGFPGQSGMADVAGVSPKPACAQRVAAGCMGGGGKTVTAGHKQGWCGSAGVRRAWSRRSGHRLSGLRQGYGCPALGRVLACSTRVAGLRNMGSNRSRVRL